MIPPDFDYREMRLFSPFSIDGFHSPCGFFNSYFYTIQGISTFITDDVFICQFSACNAIDMSRFKFGNLSTTIFCCLLVRCNHRIARSWKRVVSTICFRLIEINLENRKVLCTVSTIEIVSICLACSFRPCLVGSQEISYSGCIFQNSCSTSTVSTVITIICRSTCCTWERTASISYTCACSIYIVQIYTGNFQCFISTITSSVSISNMLNA